MKDTMMFTHSGLLISNVDFLSGVEEGTALKRGLYQFMDYMGYKIDVDISVSIISCCEVLDRLVLEKLKII